MRRLASRVIGQNTRIDDTGIAVPIGLLARTTCAIGEGLTDFRKPEIFRLTALTSMSLASKLETNLTRGPCRVFDTTFLLYILLKTSVAFSLCLSPTMFLSVIAWIEFFLLCSLGWVPVPTRPRGGSLDQVVDLAYLVTIDTYSCRGFL
jgi:hypothetical protein